jgi:hypothetical protein
MLMRAADDIRRKLRLKEGDKLLFTFGIGNRASAYQTRRRGLT